MATNSAENVREFYRKQGEQREQQRIIKLLEEMQETALSTNTKKGESTAWVIENAKVLIKGENK